MENQQTVSTVIVCVCLCICLCVCDKMDTILPKSTIHSNLCLFLHRMAMLKAIYQLCKCSLTRDSRFYVLQLHKVYFPGHVYVDFLGILMLWLLVWICPPKNLCKALLKVRNQNGYHLTTYSDCLALRRANLYTVFPKGMDTEKKFISPTCILLFRTINFESN